MLSQPTIAKTRSPEIAQDQGRLYALGLECVRALARHVWTDHNVHDPGVTTLELLSYALTDLSYRASFPLEDLLASTTIQADPNAQALFTARQILPCRPLTDRDYRKLLIDLPGVKNAWLSPVTLTYFADPVQGKLLGERPALPGIRPVSVRGLFEARVEIMDDVTTPEARDVVLRAARERLHANRNLCEDFTAVSAIESQAFMLCGELELEPDANIALVEAEVLFKVQEYLSPPVSNYTLDEMLARRKSNGKVYTVEEIFEGPALDCGFIDDAELANAELRTDVRLSDVISSMMGVEGVRTVRDMLIQPVGNTKPLANKWVVPVEGGKQATLDRTKCRLVMYKRAIPVVPPRAAVDSHYAALASAARIKVETEHRDDLLVPQGRARRAHRYHSFQNHFPALYGVGESGLPSGAGEKRKALAYQLKAYLLFFDQIMANYAAQLGRVKDLFSTDPTLLRTHFFQIVDIPEAAQIYDESALTNAFAAELGDPTAEVQRRSRFLDHLVARFAERFHDYASIVRASLHTSEESMIRTKCEFLKAYPALGAERSLAYDHSREGNGDRWNSSNVSGLERRLARLLGMPNPSRRNLGDVSYDAYAEIDGAPAEGFGFSVRHRVSGNVLVSSSSKHATPELARAQLGRAISLAQLPSAYDRKVTASGKHRFDIVDDNNEIVALSSEEFDDDVHMNTAIDDLIAYIREHYNDEGMYLIESILLRPGDPQGPFLPICIDPNCVDCADEDPYSYRMHFVLPAYAGRFANRDFRGFAEEVIRQETPAHILPKVCWISRDDMVILEKAYRDWMELSAGGPSLEQKEKLATLMTALYAAKNVYPSEPLRGCGAGEQAKFIVGQTTISAGKKSEPETPT